MEENMGTFAALLSKPGSYIPEEKREEFLSRLEALFRAGGMMDSEHVLLYGKKFTLIKFASSTDEGMNFCYNYFEDDFWENAGFTRESCSVWSGKIGYQQFRNVIVAAYVLQEQYTEGVSITFINTFPATCWLYVGWINYLFKETRHIKNFDPWKLFEMLHFSDYCYKDEKIDWEPFKWKRHAFIGWFEITAVLKGSTAAIECVDKRSLETEDRVFMHALEYLLEYLKEYRKNNREEPERQLRILMDTLQKYYQEDTDCKFWKKLDGDLMQNIFKNFILTDAPALFVKKLSEIYNKDFWALWEKIKDIAERRLPGLYGTEGYYVPPVSTAEYLEISADDMIPYWQENCDFEFTEDLKKWFQSIKQKYQKFLNENSRLETEHPLRYMVNLMSQADQQYDVYTFYDFFEESLENLMNIKYQTLWMIYEELLQKKEPKEDFDKKRQILRRFMALVANRELRKQVLGF